MPEMRAMNRSEAYLAHRVQLIFEANPDQGLREIALRELVAEAATACGLFIAEMHSTEMMATWVRSFLGKIEDVCKGVPQEIRLGPVPVPVPKQVQPDPPTQATPAPALVEDLRMAQVYAPHSFMWGDEIRDGRKAKDLRQIDLAELVGVKQTDISNLELGRIYANQALYDALHRALGIPIEVYP